MPIDNPNRIGPNQDINDPISLIELAYELQQKSNTFGVLNHIIKSQNLNDFSGGPIFNITIPVLLENGLTVEYPASGITIPGDTFVYDTSLWSSGLIITHINLPERFRNYWSGLNNVINPSGFIKGTDIADEGPTTISGGGKTRTHGSSGNISFEAAFFDPSEPYETPGWSGSGPVNYNSGTYPQLLNETSGLIIGLLQKSWKETYHYEKLRNISFTSSIQFGKSNDFGHPNSKTWVQIHNPNSFSVTVDISASLSNNLAGNGYVYSVWKVGLGQLNSPPIEPPFYSSFPTYEQLNLVGPGSITQNRSFVILPDETAFIRVFSGANVVFGGSISHSLTIKNKTITYSFP